MGTVRKQVTLVGTQVINRYNRAKAEGTKIQIKQISSYLKQFYVDCNFYPTTDQGLEALVGKPTGGRECKNYDPNGYIEGGKLPMDGFGNPFSYISDANTFEVISLGKDGQEGGEGVDADLSSKTID